MQLSIIFTSGLICLLAVSAAPPTAEEKERMKEMVEKCKAESGVDPEVFMNIKKGEPVDDKKMSCFGACMMQTVGIMNEAGEIDVKNVEQHIPEHVPKEEAMRVIELCAKEKGEDPCATAALIMKCIHENKGKELFKLGPMHE